MRHNKKFKRWFILVTLFVVVFFSIWCYMDRVRIDMNTKMDLPRWESVSTSQWQVLSQKKIFFAHMSVGNNILDGAHAVLQNHPDVALTVTRTSDPADMHLPALYHSEELGHNAEPFLKIDSFRSLVDRIRPAAPDIVLLKFCYFDIQSDTDTDALFKAYHQTIGELKTQMPSTLFLHCTVPLESPQLSMKKRCKEIAKDWLGRPTRKDNNYKRMRFNEMLRNTWPAEQILDIAQIESTTSEGFLCHKVQRGQKIPFLCSNYTPDGGHLNDVGSQRVGQQFLIFLANAVVLSEPPKQ
jgi:hypothetical protein